jgi:elongation factor P
VAVEPHASRARRVDAVIARRRARGGHGISVAAQLSVIAVIRVIASDGNSALTGTVGVGYKRRAMYDTSDIRKGLKVLMDGNPYTVVEFQFVKPGKGAAFTRTKFKNLLTGAVVERNIRSGEKLEPANVEERSMQFLYKDGEDLVFMDESNYEQVTLLKELVGENADIMKDNLPCQVLFFNDRAVDVTLPTFVFLEVTAAEPGVRGDTSGNVTKPATVETGATIAVPLFIKIGDTIKIDTRIHEYVERVNK